MKVIQNKAGKGELKSTQMLVYFLVIALVVVVIGSQTSWFGLQSKPLDITSTQVPTNPTTGQAINCAQNPSVGYIGVDALVATTNATPTSFSYIVNGVYLSSTPSAVGGASWQVLGDRTGYLAGFQNPNPATITCGAQNLNFALYNYANASVSIQNDPRTNTNTLTNGGGANNATAAAAGGSLNLPVYLTGTSQKSTSTMLWVFESSAGNKTAIQSVGLSCGNLAVKQVAVPAGYSTTNANSFTAAFEIPALINGAVSQGCVLQINNAATLVASGLMRNTIYAEQAFVDANGQPQFGAFDSSLPYGNNAAKYQDSYTYNFAVQ